MQVKAVGEFLDLAAHRPKACGQRRDSIAFLDAELAGAGHRQLAAGGCHRRQSGDFVDEAGNVIRTERQRLQCTMPNPDPPTRFAVLDTVYGPLDLRTGAGQNVEKGSTGGIQPEVEDFDVGSGSDAAATAQNVADEGSPGTAP